MPGTTNHDVPHCLTAWMQPFRTACTAPTWRLVLVLVTGAILVPGRRTVASALRVMGLDQISNFTKFHRVLNGARWSPVGCPDACSNNSSTPSCRQASRW
jgi:hypothetical protein